MNVKFVNLLEYNYLLNCLNIISDIFGNFRVIETFRKDKSQVDRRFFQIYIIIALLLLEHLRCSSFELGIAT